jgi:hypothetical protein
MGFKYLVDVVLQIIKKINNKKQNQSQGLKKQSQDVKNFKFYYG